MLLLHYYASLILVCVLSDDYTMTSHFELLCIRYNNTEYLITCLNDQNKPRHTV